ncbi:hypothetical protein ACFWPX_29615 [Nocardia sp. NPDC058518]|uniref:hypothetical protein n=1 Tax=Nocardia sp. NPDC058518 TaxID=3346534 RepID=UPI003667B8F6
MKNRRSKLGLLAATFAVLSGMAIATVQAAPSELNIQPEPGPSQGKDLPTAPSITVPTNPGTGGGGTTPTGSPSTPPEPSSTAVQEAPTTPKAPTSTESSTTKKKSKPTPGQELPELGRQPGNPNAPGADWAPAPQ